MTEHLSALDLDEVAAGLAAEAVRSHADRCADCRARVGEIQNDRSTVLADPRFAIGRQRLAAPTGERRWRWSFAGVGVIGMAAGVALLFLVPQRLHLQPKGGRPTLALVSSDGKPVEIARMGEVVEVRANPAGHRYALIVAIDESPPAATVLWPPGAGNSGAIASGKTVSVRVRVTAGAARIVAAFSDWPLSARDIEGAPPAGVDMSQLEIVPRP